MKSRLASIGNLTSCCLSCGSFWPNSGLFCRTCELILEKYRSTQEHQIESIKAQTIYDWVPQRSDALSNWILHMKRSRNFQDWGFLAVKFLSQRSFKEDYLVDNNKILVVPAPAKKTGSPDHAYRWGQALARALGADFVPCLKRGDFDGVEQKNRSAWERTLVETEINEKYTDWPKEIGNCLWMFADDIVTTGSTAKSAHRALGSPTHFLVAALVYRRLSCGGPKNLL